MSVWVVANIKLHSLVSDVIAESEFISQYGGRGQVKQNCVTKSVEHDPRQNKKMASLHLILFTHFGNLTVL